MSPRTRGRKCLPFSYTPDDIVADRLTLRGDEAHHVTVRRYSVGDFVEVVDGQGGFYRVRIDRIERTSVHGLIMDREPERGESPVRLHLAAAVMKGSHRFDHVVEKATEVGVASIRPMMAERGGCDRKPFPALAALGAGGGKTMRSLPGTSGKGAT